MFHFVYVDCQNLSTEGKAVKAVEDGLATNISVAMNSKILQPSYEIDFGNLIEFIPDSDDEDIYGCTLFGSRPPSSDTIWNKAEKANYDVVIADRNVPNSDGLSGTGITVAMFRDARSRGYDAPDVFNFVSGEADLAPIIWRLVDKGSFVRLVYWDHVDEALIDACSDFVSLNQYINRFSRE